MKYINVYKDIKTKIEKGIYRSWDTLEGEEMLCNLYGVSRTTIRKAIAKLKQDGYIHSRQGSGSFVNPPEFYEEKNLTTLSEKMNEFNNIQNIILDFREVDATQRLSKMFNLRTQSKIYHYKRLRKINDVPKVFEETYMPKYLFNDFSKEKLKGSVLKYIEEECNYTISHDLKNISAINIDKELSELLCIDERIATLQIDHKVYLMKSILAQYTREIQTKNNIRFVSVR